MPRRKDPPPEMEPVARRIAAWREERERVGPMPEDLWLDAVSLAGKYGVSPTARGLKIDYGCLRTRHEQALEHGMDSAVVEREGTPDGKEPAPNGPAAESFRFVELDSARLAEPPVVGETTIEMVRHDGATMTVRLPSTTAFDLGGLVESFWRRCP